MQMALNETLTSSMQYLISSSVVRSFPVTLSLKGTHSSLSYMTGSVTESVKAMHLCLHLCLAAQNVN
jgi:hypothetical protein